MITKNYSKLNSKKKLGLCKFQITGNLLKWNMLLIFSMAMLLNPRILKMMAQALVRISDINSYIDVDACKKGRSREIFKYFCIQDPEGDILIAMTGATIGKNCQYRQSDTIYANQRVGIIRAKEGSAQGYLRYLINTYELNEYIKIDLFWICSENISSNQINDFWNSTTTSFRAGKNRRFLDQKTTQIDTIIEKK